MNSRLLLSTHWAGGLQSPGTGPFFGEKTHFAGWRSSENMDLSPSPLDFAALPHIRRRRKIGNLSIPKACRTFRVPQNRSSRHVRRLLARFNIFVCGVSAARFLPLGHPRTHQHGNRFHRANSYIRVKIQVVAVCQHVFQFLVAVFQGGQLVAEQRFINLLTGPNPSVFRQFVEIDASARILLARACRFEQAAETTAAWRPSFPSLRRKRRQPVAVGRRQCNRS